MIILVGFALTSLFTVSFSNQKKQEIKYHQATQEANTSRQGFPLKHFCWSWHTLLANEIHQITVFFSEAFPVAGNLGYKCFQSFLGNSFYITYQIHIVWTLKEFQIHYSIPIFLAKLLKGKLFCPCTFRTFLWIFIFYKFTVIIYVFQYEPSFNLQKLCLILVPDLELYYHSQFPRGTTFLSFSILSPLFSVKYKYCMIFYIFP